MRKTQIMPSNESIRAMWDIKKKLNVPACLDSDTDLTYEMFYRKYKKPRDVYIG